jgi:hypothetical protein
MCDEVEVGSDDDEGVRKPRRTLKERAQTRRDYLTKELKSLEDFLLVLEEQPGLEGFAELANRI